MPKKYNIEIATAPPRYYPVGKYTTIEFREDCAGSCRECVKKKCIYDLFKETQQHISKMKEPEYLYTCMSCFRCVQECTKGIFSRVINPEFRSLGDAYWHSNIISSTWYQAHTGGIPVSGAGYRGPFVGKGFDSMWTDMSEIVRPTRDGIHGREYINTCIELSRSVTRLQFNKDKSISTKLPPILEIPIPLLFRPPEFGMISDNVLKSFALAAQNLGTMMFIRPENYTEALIPFAVNLIPCLTTNNYRNYTHLIKQSKMVEIAYERQIAKVLPKLLSINPDLIIAVGVPLNAKAAERSVFLTQIDVDTLHFYADHHGNELDAENPRFLKEMIREVHLTLVNRHIRQKVKTVFSGGIAMAEHMAKSIICGADGITIDNSLLLALECRLCYRCKAGKPCPVKLETVDPLWGSRRITNLVAAWRNQLLEIMGAMGIREARRLRGEVGRSLWFENLEKENFGPIFGERKVAGLGI